jgi:hypothetical protein
MTSIEQSHYLGLPNYQWIILICKVINTFNKTCDVFAKLKIASTVLYFLVNVLPNIHNDKEQYHPEKNVRFDGQVNQDWDLFD